MLIFCICFSHKNDDSLYFKNLGETLIKLEYKKTLSAKIPFNQIHVVDARSDTTCVGFFRYNSVENIKKILFLNSLKTEVVDFVSANYQLSNNDTLNNLLIILKEFRICNNARAKVINENSNLELMNAGVIVNAELFLQNKNTFHALYKVDTLY